MATSVPETPHVGGDNEGATDETHRTGDTVVVAWGAFKPVEKLTDHAWAPLLAFGVCAQNTTGGVLGKSAVSSAGEPAE